MSDQDLGDLIAYIRTLPPVDRQTGGSLSFLGNAMYGAGMFGDLLVASNIDHASRPPAPPAPGVTVEYGDYLVRINGCRACHGQELAGGRVSGSRTLPSRRTSHLAANFGPGLRSNSSRPCAPGVTPSGTEMNYMPWEYKGQMTDDELKAVFAYLTSLPDLPTSTGSRCSA